MILSDIEQSIKRKIEAVGVPLKDWDINIYRGILTGYNEAFIISGEKKKEILNSCKTQEERTKTEQLIRPILRGRDIKKYSYDFAELWLINSHNGIKEKGIKPVNIDDYPAIKEHLDQFYPVLEKRADKGITPYNLRNCAYMEDFSKQKIVYIEIMTDNPNEGFEFPSFSFDMQKSIILNTAYIMTGKDNDLKHILGILNSKIGRVLVKSYVVQLQQRQYRMLGQYVSNFPIPRAIDSKISSLTDKILYNVSNKIEIEELQKELNTTIYCLYGFNETEIEFIESQ